MPDQSKRSRLGALAVGAGIFLSRLAGLVRERVIAHYLGTSLGAAAFKAAIRIPNLLQNLFGEGVLSASFIPVYSRLRAEGRDEEANHVARVVFTLLLFLTSIVVAIGILAAPVLVALIVPGFEGEVRDLTVELVEIIFPGVGILVLSAWCLGVLNSHRRFFLSYVAPVLWNAGQVAALLAVGLQVGASSDSVRLAHALAWGTVAGAGLQLAVQIPSTLRLLKSFGLSFGFGSAPVKQVFSSFVPVVFARGVVQVSAFIDEILASLIAPAAIAWISYAQQLYLLPVSLFGMAIAASALPEMSSATGDRESIHAKVRGDIAVNRTRMGFFVIPSAIAFLTIGDAVIGLLFQTGRFTASDSDIVWAVLCGSAVGLYAATQSRLLSSAFYALSDTKTPLRFAIVRVTLGAIMGWSMAVPLREHFGWPPVIAAAGLTAAAGVVAWIEMLLLSAALQRRIGRVPRNWSVEARIVVAALASGAGAFAVHRTLPLEGPILDGAITVATFGVIYFGLGALLGIDQARAILRRAKLLR